MGDAGISFNSQASIFHSIDRYTDGLFFGNGVVLLVLCLFTWLNSAIADASAALRVSSAVRTRKEANEEPGNGAGLYRWTQHTGDPAYG